MISLITLHTPGDNCHSYGFLIPTTNHYLKVIEFSDCVREEYQILSQICKETNSVPFYHYFYESKTSLLKSFYIKESLPDNICAIEMELKKGSTTPLENPTHLPSLLNTLMDILERLYHHGYLYTDFNLSNLLVDLPTSYGAPPCLYLIDFTNMLSFNSSTIRTPSMDTCSHQLLEDSLPFMYGTSTEAHRTRVLFLHRMVAVTALRLMGFVDVPLNPKHPEQTLSPNHTYYQKVLAKLGEPLLKKIDFGFRFCGQIDTEDIFSKWRKNL
jgi:hypothetical protein